MSLTTCVCGGGVSVDALCCICEVCWYVRWMCCVVYVQLLSID